MHKTLLATLVATALTGAATGQKAILFTGRFPFVSLDAATGKMIWGSPGREGENAAVLASDRYVFFLTDNADLTVVEAGQESYQLLARSTVAESPTWAHPVILTDGVLIKDLKHLTRWTVAP